MSHSQRQKKRSSQFKKRHFEAKGRGHGEPDKKEREPRASAASEPQTKPSQQQAGPSSAPPEREGEREKEGEREREREGGSRSGDSKKYSRRAMTSNWERYSHEDEAGESFSPAVEEQLQLRLAQLLNLPQVDPTQWGSEKGERDEREGLLCLNVADLAESLTTVPLCVRLDLSPDLLQSYGVREEEWEKLDTSHHDELDLLTAPSVTAEPDLPSLLSRARHRETESFDFSSPRQKTQPSLETASAPDTELDYLLFSCPPLNSDPRPHLCETTPPQPPPRQAKLPSLATTSLPSTTELDDMLDDLLS